MSEVPHHLSEPFADLLKSCATCGGTLPCALHDATLREAILRPPEAFPWHALVRTELGKMEGALHAMLLLPDGTVLIGSDEGRLRRFHPLDGGDERFETVGLFQEHDDIMTLQALPNGTILAGTSLGTLLHADLSKPFEKRMEHLEHVGGDINAFHARPDGTFIVVGMDGRIDAFDPEAQLSEPPRSFDIYENAGWLSVDERLERLVSYGSDVYVILPLGGSEALLFGGDDGNLVRLDPSQPEGERTQVLAHYGRAILAIEPFTDGTFLVSGDGGSIMLFDPAKPEGARLEKIASHGRTVQALSVVSDLAFLVGEYDGTITRYEIPETALRAWRERRLGGGEIPPMPEA